MMKVLIVLPLLVALCLAESNPNIVRPCRMSDTKCIGRNLAANSNCDANVDGIIPHKYLIPKYRYDTPYFNSSYIETNLLITNMDKCHAAEFYIDRSKDLMVLTIECEDLNFDTDRTLIQHYSYCHDTEYFYHFNGTYPLVRMTYNFKPAASVNPCIKTPFTEVPCLPKMQIDPKDQRTNDFLTTDLSLLSVYIVEDFYTRGKYISRDIINHLYCNFGCGYKYPENDCGC